jgi:hypothetical protein
MKSRVIYTDLWIDDDFHTLNIDTRMLYLAVLLNPQVNQLRIYKCSDRQLALYSGLTSSQVAKCKDDLEVAQLAYFKNGWVLLASDIGYVQSNYTGKSNLIAQAKEINRIPRSILDYFLMTLDTLSIPYREYVDTTLNLNLNLNLNGTATTVEKPVEDVEAAQQFFETMRNN